MTAHTITYAPASLARQLPGPHIWLLDFSQLDTLAPGHYQQLLSADEQARALTYRQGQREFIACRALVRLCLARYTGADPRTLSFTKNPSGKPLLCAPHHRWHFNLSHSGSHAALAVLDNASIGLDLEQPRARAYLRIARQYFHPQETTWLQTLPEAQLPGAFFQLWTLKEAFFKALGGGIATGLQRARFYWEETGVLHHSFAEDLHQAETDWTFYQTRQQLPALTHIALAYRAPAAPVQWFDGAELFDGMEIV